MKTGLVLSGGGARGAYEIGVWKALDELNIKCDIVTGVSIGSINAALYAQQNYKIAEKMWKRINFETVFQTDTIPKTKKDLRKKYLKSARNGGLEPINLKKNLTKIIDPKKVKNSEIDFGLLTVSYPSMRIIEKTKNKIEPEKLIDYIVASSTVFPVFKIKEIDNQKFVDGGFRQPIPIDLAKKLGAEKIIVVNISALRKRKDFKKEKDIITIKPTNKIGPILKFDDKIATRNIDYGYFDTMKKFKKLDGKKYTFKGLKEEYETNRYKYNYTYSELLSKLEYIGTYFEIDSCKLYTLKSYHEAIKKVLDFTPIDINNKIKIKDLLTRKERIIYIYTALINNKKLPNNTKKIFNKDYEASLYLKNFIERKEYEKIYNA